MPNRRDFLFLRPQKGRPFELSCAGLYTRYLDAIDECATGDLAEAVEGDLRERTTVRVTGTVWLERDDFRAWLDPILARLESRGVRIVFDAARA